MEERHMVHQDLDIDDQITITSSIVWCIRACR